MSNKRNDHARKTQRRKGALYRIERSKKADTERAIFEAATLRARIFSAA